MDIDIPDAVQIIKDAVFAYTDLKEFVFPSGITTIYEYTFQCCEMLKKVVIPASVTEIRKHAFEQCTALTTVYYEGSRADWDKITIGEDNAYLLNAEIVYDYKEE